MKKIFLLSVTVFMFICGVDSVNAMTLKPVGTSSGKKGEDITLFVALERSDNEKVVSSIEGRLVYDSSILELINYNNIIDNWIQFSPISNGGVFAYGNVTFDKLITSNNQNILKIVFKVKSTANNGTTVISVINPSATDDDGNSIEIYGGSHHVNVLSDVNTLKSISVYNSDINFAEDVTEYNLIINSDSTIINAIKKDDKSTISGDIGETKLDYGLNILKIAVTSESGESKVYTLNITRPDNRSKTNTLSNLKLSEYEINYDKNITEYNLVVENNITTIKIDSSLSDVKSSFVPGYGPRNIDLDIGSNKVELKVKAENDEIRVYTINITRKNSDINKTENISSKSNNNYLSELKLYDIPLLFDKNKTDYNVSVLYDVDKTSVMATTEDEKAKYEIIGKEELVVGENVIIIKVTAEDNSEREYKIKIIRQAENIKLSSDSKLKKMVIDGYEINFNSNIYEYKIKISDDRKLKIDYVVSDVKSVAQISGNNNLENGSLVEVIVLAEDGTRSVYKIFIEKAQNEIIIFTILTLLISLSVMAVIVLKNKNRLK